MFAPHVDSEYLLWQAVYLLVKADDLFDAAFHFFLKTNSRKEESHKIIFLKIAIKLAIY